MSEYKNLSLSFSSKWTIYLRANHFDLILYNILSTKFLLEGNILPSSRVEAKKVMKMLGFDYNSIHTCENDCILFKGEYETLNSCPKCGNSRYKDHDTPRKVLRKFPLLSRIKHIFQSLELAKLMDWNSVNSSRDNVMTHEDSS